MVLLIDNYDSFTYNLKHYIEYWGVACEVIRNDDPVMLQPVNERYSSVVLSPGPGTPSTSAYLMKALDTYVHKVPVLGICLGHQAIGMYFGAKLVRAAKPMHGKVSEIFHNQHNMFNQVPAPFQATRYHSLLLEEPNEEELQVTAFTQENEIMAISHKRLPVWGIQFHPEAILTQYGKQLIGNWLQAHDL